VQIAGGGFDEAGAGFDRITSAIEKTQGESESEMPQWAKDLGEAIDRLTAWLDSHEGSSSPPRRPGE
jgi:hypothetical protein